MGVHEKGVPVPKEMKGIIRTKDGHAFVCKELGGPGSGNFGHAGVPGERGGAAPGGGATASHVYSSSRYSTEEEDDVGEEISKKLDKSNKEYNTGELKTEIEDLAIKIGKDKYGRGFLVAFKTDDTYVDEEEITRTTITYEVRDPGD